MVTVGVDDGLTAQVFWFGLRVGSYLALHQNELSSCNGLAMMTVL